MKPVYAVGGVVALALLVLAGWFIVRATPETTTLEPVPVETAVIAAHKTEATETAVLPTEEPAPTIAPPTETPTEPPPTAAPTKEPPTYQEYEIGEDIWGSAFADLNGDAFPDLALSDIGMDAILLLFNRGDGTFEEAAQITTGENPYSVAAADLDGDGDNDLVASNDPEDGGDAFSVLINKGDGTFQPQVDYPTAFEAWFPVPVDLDADGDLDLVMDLITAQIPAGEAAVGLWTNKGDGSFEEGERLYFGVPQIGHIMPVDLNGDALIDLVARNWPEPLVTVLLGNNEGGFGEPQEYATEARNQGFAVADLTGDGFPDVVTVNAHGVVSLLPNDGEGAFPERVGYELGGEIWNVEAIDLTGDGALDLLVGPTGSGMASLLQNDGRGGLELVKNYYFPGAWAAFFETADVDGDGHPEIIGFTDGTLYIFPLETP